MNDGMGVSPEYEALAIGLSLLCLVLAFIHLWRSTRTYQAWHDERAAVSLGKAVGIVVISLGFLISASGLAFENPILSVAGLSMARGATVVLLGTLLLAHVSPEHRDSVGDSDPQSG